MENILNKVFESYHLSSVSGTQLSLFYNLSFTAYASAVCGNDKLPSIPIKKWVSLSVVFHTLNNLSSDINWGLYA